MNKFTFLSLISKRVSIFTHIFNFKSAIVDKSSEEAQNTFFVYFIQCSFSILCNTFSNKRIQFGNNR